MEKNYQTYSEINCNTKDRVIECIGYRTGICEGICAYAKVYDRFHGSLSGLERYNKRIKKTQEIQDRIIRQSERTLVEMAGQSMDCK